MNKNVRLFLVVSLLANLVPTNLYCMDSGRHLDDVESALAQVLGTTNGSAAADDPLFGEVGSQADAPIAQLAQQGNQRGGLFRMVKRGCNACIPVGLCLTASCALFGMVILVISVVNNPGDPSGPPPTP